MGRSSLSSSQDQGGDESLSSVYLPAITQGSYYLVTGIWPLVSMGTFQLLTGRKKDLWLVQSVALLLSLIGATLLLAVRRRHISPEIALLATGTAASLTGIDVVYYRRGQLRFVYLIDAVAEMTLIAWWGITWFARARR